MARDRECNRYSGRDSICITAGIARMGNSMARISSLGNLATAIGGAAQWTDVSLLG